jgi:hypothetical protein
MRLSKLRKLNPSTFDKVCLWQLENEEMEAFCNTIAPFPMPLSQSLHNLQRCGAFITAFITEKLKMTIKKSLFRNWQSIPNFFIAHLPILVRCKINGAIRVVLVLLHNWQLGA